jgi:LacI family transcriptional regulator
MKKTTMMDIATIAGVSKATVSMVISGRDQSISEETKKRILIIAKELNYIPNSIARSLSTNKSGTIGIILPDILNPFFSEMARAIEDSAGLLGYNVIFCNTDNELVKEEKYIKLLISKSVDGVIFIAGSKSAENVKILKCNNVPFVIVDRYIDGYEDMYGVFCENTKGVMEAISYLYEKGRRHIAFVMGPKELAVSKLRLDGYKNKMKEYKIYDKSLIFQGDLTIEGGIRAAERIIATACDVDAIFFSNDAMAIGGMKIFIRKGYKIPQDISIIGYDNVQISHLIEPELTTVGQPIYDMGKESCRLLINIINEVEIQQKQIYFKSELIIRGTT